MELSSKGGWKRCSGIRHKKIVKKKKAGPNRCTNYPWFICTFRKLFWLTSRTKNNTSRGNNYCHARTHGTYRLVVAVIRCGVFRGVQAKKCRAQFSPRRLSSKPRVAEAQRAQHPALLPLLEQLQLTQAGQAGLQPLLVSTPLLFHGQRKRRQHKLRAARLGRRHRLVFLPGVWKGGDASLVGDVCFGGSGSHSPCLACRLVCAPTGGGAVSSRTQLSLGHRRPWLNYAQSFAPAASVVVR